MGTASSLGQKVCLSTDNLARTGSLISKCFNFRKLLQTLKTKVEFWMHSCMFLYMISPWTSFEFDWNKTLGKDPPPYLKNEDQSGKDKQPTIVFHIIQNIIQSQHPT